MSTSHTNKIYFDDMIEVKNEKFYKTFDSFLKFYKQFRQNEILDLNQREKKYNLEITHCGNKRIFQMSFIKNNGFRKSINIERDDDDFKMISTYNGSLLKQLQAAFEDDNIVFSEGFNVYINFITKKVDWFTFYDWSKLSQKEIQNKLIEYDVPVD